MQEEQDTKTSTIWIIATTPDSGGTLAIDLHGLNHQITTFERFPFNPHHCGPIHQDGSLHTIQGTRIRCTKPRYHLSRPSLPTSRPTQGYRLRPWTSIQLEILAR